jgi:hypothetical protein
MILACSRFIARSRGKQESKQTMSGSYPFLNNFRMLILPPDLHFCNCGFAGAEETLSKTEGSSTSPQLISSLAAAVILFCGPASPKDAATPIVADA